MFLSIEKVTIRFFVFHTIINMIRSLNEKEKNISPCLSTPMISPTIQIYLNNVHKMQSIIDQHIRDAYNFNYWLFSVLFVYVLLINSRWWLENIEIVVCATSGMCIMHNVDFFSIKTQTYLQSQSQSVICRK